MNCAMTLAWRERVEWKMGTMAQAKPQLIDPAQIRRALSVLHERGEVFEIRAMAGSLRRPLSGYFDDHDKAVDAARERVRRGAEGVYVTLNPVKAELLARARNRVIEVKTGGATADKDITQLRWQFIDLDPVRPSGISSTEAEHNAALDKAREIAKWLQGYHFMRGLVADSGNGAHLLYPIDLPTAENGLVSQLLRILNMVFTDDRVKVDLTTFNPARIIKLYGTPARKGDSTPDRPHRLARLMEVQENLEPVPKERLEEIAAFAQYEAEPASARATGAGFDTRERLSSWGLEVLREEPYGDGARLVLRSCPFGEHRKEAKAAVFINGDGRRGFHCFSDDHVGLNWKELRARFEPAAVASTDGAGGLGRALPDEQSAAFSEPAHGWPEPPAERRATEPRSSSPAQPEWPKPPNEAAYQGLAGEFVKLVEPHTEADPAALLVQFLIGFGNLCGAASYRFAGGVAHHLNEYGVIVGDTSRARKGTSWAEVERFLEKADGDWTKHCVTSGLSTGEGLIWHVRDPQETDGRGNGEAAERNGRNGHALEAGVMDKRLMVQAGEFAAVLKVATRDGSTLSPVLREAWDGKVLRTLSKNNPATATGAHVSITAHITHEELARGLDSTEIANGFANRFVWVCARRSKLLPWGGSVQDNRLDSLATAVRRAAENARKPREFTFNEEAKQRWEQCYEQLTDARPGLLGAIVGRSEAHVLHFACTYAALDSSHVITVEHLNAALALWEYCERSARHIFGNRLGNPDADTILEALREKREGFTRTDIRNLFSRNMAGERIDRARDALRKARLDPCRKRPYRRALRGALDGRGAKPR